MIETWLAGFGAVFWLMILVLPWQPWRIRETLEAAGDNTDADLSDVTVLIPARNEASVLPQTLRALSGQRHGLRIVVADDQSNDGTASIAGTLLQPEDCVVSVTAPPADWTGKLWALEQARARASSPLLLLLDADIVLAPGTVSALRAQLRAKRLQLVSLMALLHTQSGWERALMPAFVYFFKLLYPFRLANDRAYPRVAAAAGGCILIEAAALARIGGFSALRGALIDDCTLAARIKRDGGNTWIGLTHSALSIRSYDGLVAIWNMVARCAFTQLRHSWWRLAGVSAIFLLAFGLPFAGLASAMPGLLLSLIAFAAMVASFLPMVRFYRLPAAWALALPAVAALFLAMSWSSAWRWQFSGGTAWKGRAYSPQPK